MIKQFFFHTMFVLFMACYVTVPCVEAQPDPASTAPVKYTFPFSAYNYNAPIVQVKIKCADAHNYVTASFVIDTGSGTNVISDTVAAKLGFKPQPTASHGADFSLDGKPAQMVSPLSLQIGQLTLEGGAYLIVKAKTLAASSDSDVDGIISMQVLRYFALDVDAVKHQITLWYPGGLTEDAVEKAGFGRAASVLLTPSIPSSVLHNPVKATAAAESYWNLTYSLPVRISDGVHASDQQLLLDTGSSGTVFSAEVSTKLRLKVSQTLEVPTVTQGMDIVDTVTAPQIQIGELSLINQRVYVSHSNFTQRAPILGNDVLDAYHVLVDFEAKKMYLKPIAEKLSL